MHATHTVAAPFCPVLRAYLLLVAYCLPYGNLLPAVLDSSGDALHCAAMCAEGSAALQGAAVCSPKQTCQGCDDHSTWHSMMERVAASQAIVCFSVPQACVMHKSRAVVLRCPNICACSAQWPAINALCDPSCCNKLSPVTRLAQVQDCVRVSISLLHMPYRSPPCASSPLTRQLCWCYGNLLFLLTLRR